MRECFYVVSILCDDAGIHPSAVDAAMLLGTISRTNYSIVYVLSLPVEKNEIEIENTRANRRKANILKTFSLPSRDKLIEL